MSKNPDNKLLLDATIDYIYHIIISRDKEAYNKLTGIICATIEAMAEQYEDMTASEMARFICKQIEHYEQKGGEE